MAGGTEVPKKSSSLLKPAVEALSQGKHEEAVRICKQILKQQGAQNNYDALVVLGKALFASKQYDPAEASYRRAATLNPSALRAWQGLAELYEATENFDKIVEAYESVIEIARITDDKPRLTDYLCRFARTCAKSHDYDKACQTWNVLLGIPSLTETQKLEAICGLADAQAEKMEKLRLEVNRHLSQVKQSACSIDERDISRPVAFSHSMAKEDCSFSVKDERQFYDIVESLEALLSEIIRISPQTQKYQDLFLKLQLERMQGAKFVGGDRYKMAQLQVMRHCVAMLSSFCSDTALKIAFTMCEEDNVGQIFQDIGMEKLVDDRQERILWLGRHFTHIYPQHSRSLAVVAYAMHCRSVYSLDRIKSFCMQVLELDATCITGWHVLAELWSFEKSLIFL